MKITNTAFQNFAFRIKSNQTKIFSFITALIVICFFPWVKIYISNWSVYSLQQRKEFSDIVASILENGVFALLVYVFFGSQIDRWLGHDVTESIKFNPEEFIKNVSKSTHSVIIQETYIRILITHYKDDFEAALKSFLSNCQKTNSNLTGRIRVIVLHPLGEAIRMRHHELQGYVDESLLDFLTGTKNLLMQIKEVRDNINKLAGNKDFFEIKTAYEKPDFSLYYCDRYASISYYANIPCEDAPQLVFFLKKRTNAVAQKHKVLFEQYWDKGSLLTDQFFSLAVSKDDNLNKFIEIIDCFKTITKSVSETDIINNLKRISEICFNNALFTIELINYIESNHRKKNINYINAENAEHYGILGTGGDDQRSRTINISTIVSILASHYFNSDLHITGITVIKVGTLAVTGKVGSQTFYETLQSSISAKTPEYEAVPKKIYLDYNLNNGSTFLPIIYFGYMYRQILRDARKQFISSNPNCIDIYKIIFPLANLTGYKAAINGVSKDEYFSIFKQIYEIKQKTGIILKNERDVDELCFGQNTIVYYQNGKEIFSSQLNIRFIGYKATLYQNFFRECDKPDHGDEHVKKFFKLFDNNDPAITDAIRETICYNVALFVQLYFLTHYDYPQTNAKKKEEDFSKERLKKIMLEIKNSYFGRSPGGLPA